MSTADETKPTDDSTVKSWPSTIRTLAKAVNSTVASVSLEDVRAVNNIVAGPIDMGSNIISNLTDPVADTDAATRAFVISIATGIKYKADVATCSVANLTLSGNQTVNGIVLVDGDRILVKDQTDATANGIYVVATGAWARAGDADTGDEIVNSAVFVSAGTVNSKFSFICSITSIILGTTNIVYVVFMAGADDASTTVKGIIEIATGTEVNTGVDNVRAVTPAGLQGRSGTETGTGLLRLATSAESIVGESSTIAIHPLGLAATISSRLSSPGPVGNVTPSTGDFTAVSAATGFTGNVTGDVLGNITGNISGNITGDVNTTSIIFNGEAVILHGYSINTAEFISSFDGSAKDTYMSSLFFSPDGLIMYIGGYSSDTIYQYTLSTAWDISTAIYASKSLNISSSEPAMMNIFFSPTGTILYLVGNNAIVYQYTLSTAWDISTGTYVKNISVSGVELLPESIFFSPDGLIMYIGGVNSFICYYNLSTAWDVSTAVYNNSYSVSEVTKVSTIFFSPDGKYMFISDGITDNIYMYVLSTAWNPTFARYTGRFLFIGNKEDTIESLFFNPTGLRMYILGRSSNSVHQYRSGIFTI